MSYTLDNSLKLAAVVGDPIDQSLSPVIHNEWCQRAGIKGLYIPLRVEGNQADFNLAIDGLRKAGFSGVNVTMPHKTHALNYADKQSDDAVIINAANMLSFTNRTSLAQSSDGRGLIAAITPALRAIDETLKTVLVLGAGGASGAICRAIIDYGFSKLIICNRTKSKAINLCARLTPGLSDQQDIQIVDWGDRSSIHADIVINSSALGMSDMGALDFNPDPKKGHKIIVDIVYKPLDTPLLWKARQAGLYTVNGLEMLMHQAVPGFEEWFAGPAQVDDGLRQILHDEIYNNKTKTFQTIGLTGSIGMGKSTVARMFEELGCAVWDADAAVHRLYSKGGRAVTALAEDFPGAIVKGEIDRNALSKEVLADGKKMKILESIIHPLVAVDRALFLRQMQTSKKEIAVLDIPLLFENNAQAGFDHTLVVTASSQVQAERVLARRGMTREKFNAILSRQMADTDKRALADHVIATDTSLTATRHSVETLLKQIGS